jgi:hypothetical protein
VQFAAGRDLTADQLNNMIDNLSGWCVCLYLRCVSVKVSCLLEKMLMLIFYICVFDFSSHIQPSEIILLHGILGARR